MDRTSVRIEPETADSARIQALHIIEQHLQMNRGERRRAGIRTPRRIIEATRDELRPYTESIEIVETRLTDTVPQH